MGSSRTGLDLEDTPRTKFCGPGLGLEDLWPWPWWCTALALASRAGRKTLNFWVWLISKGLNTINTILHTQAQEAAVGRWIWEWWTDRRRGITALCVASRGKKTRDGGPRRLASTCRTPRGQNFVALALKTSGGLGLEDPWPWPRPCCPRTHPWLYGSYGPK